MVPVPQPWISALRIQRILCGFSSYGSHTSALDFHAFSVYFQAFALDFHARIQRLLCVFCSHGSQAANWDQNNSASKRVADQAAASSWDAKKWGERNHANRDVNDRIWAQGNQWYKVQLLSKPACLLQYGQQQL